MLNLKSALKHFIGKIRCAFHGIRCKKVYIGRHVHFEKGKHIVIGANTEIRPFCDIFATEQLVIGERCDIGTRTRLEGNVTLENDVLVGPDVLICRTDHKYQDIAKPIKDQGGYLPMKNGHDRLIIGEGSWIGTHAVVVGDVHIGKHCVIGANAVVTKDIPDYSVAVGQPAVVVKKYNLVDACWEKVAFQRDSKK
jgi:acetyltransferase-like isoleucine patch superfamily enzyme